MPPAAKSPPPLGGRWALPIAIAVMVLLAAGFAAELLTGSSGLLWTDYMVAQKHFPAVIGLPMAAVGAFIIVAVLQQSSGAIQFEALGLKFRGAAGQVMMWVICFLAIVLALRLVWSLS